MISRSVFLSLAAGLLTSLAFGTPSQASSTLVTVQRILDPLAPGNTVSPVDDTFNEAFTDLKLIIPLAGSAGGAAPATFTKVSESAVSKPASMSLLGIGMAGFFTYRRWFKRLASA